MRNYVNLNRRSSALFIFGTLRKCSKVTLECVPVPPCLSVHARLPTPVFHHIALSSSPQTPRTFIEHRLRFHICRKMLQINFFNGKTCPTPQSISRNKTVFPKAGSDLPPRYGPYPHLFQITTHCIQRDVPAKYHATLQPVLFLQQSACPAYVLGKYGRYSLLSARDGLNIKLSSMQR